MAKSLYLTKEEKLLGLKHMYRQEMFNGISYNLIGGTFVYIMAVLFNANTYVLGYISSAVYFAGAILPIVPRLFKGKNIIKVQSTAWLMRGLISFGYILLLFLSEKWAITLIIVLYSLFCIFRVIGVSLNDYTIKSVCNSTNKGRVTGNINMAYQSSSIIVCCMAAVYLSFDKLSGLIGLVILQIIGASMNTFSSMHMRKIPCRRNIAYIKGRGIVTLFKESMKNEVRRRRLILRWVSSSLVVAFSMSVPFLKISIGLNNSTIMLYSAAVGIAAMTSGIVNKHYADRLGSKPIAIISGLLFMFISVLWITFPSSVGGVFFFILGIFGNFFLWLLYFSVFRLIAAVIPDEDAISFNSMSNFVIAISAFITGFIAGFLAKFDLSEIFAEEGFHGGNSYSFVFMFVFFLSVVFLIESLKLKEQGALSSQQAAKVMFSVHGMQALSQIEKLGHTYDPYKRRMILTSLGTNTNRVATNELRMILSSPFTLDKNEIIQSLADRPRLSLLDDLIKVASNDDSYSQINAIVALGSYNKNEKAIKTLNRLLYSRWSSVRSVACKSLSKIAIDKEALLEKVMELSKSARHIDEEIDYLMAKKNLDKEGVFYEDFFISVNQNRAETYRQTRYALIASFLHFGSPVLSHLYSRINIGEYEEAIFDFLNDALDETMVLENFNSIYTAFIDKNFSYLRRISLDMLNESNLEHNKAFNHLKIGLLEAEKIEEDKMDLQDYIALFYFSYSLKINSKS